MNPEEIIFVYLCIALYLRTPSTQTEYDPGILGMFHPPGDIYFLDYHPQ